MRVAAITGHALLEFVFGQVLHDLGEDGTAEVHPPFCGLLLFRPKQPISAAPSSNRKIRVSGYQSDSAQVIRFQKSLAGHQCSQMIRELLHDFRDTAKVLKGEEKRLDRRIDQMKRH